MLALVELWNRDIHGESSEKCPEGHFINQFGEVDLDEFLYPKNEDGINKWFCEYDCGKIGTFDEIWKHETMCSKKPKTNIKRINTASSIIEYNYNNLGNNFYDLKFEIVKNYEFNGYFLSILLTTHLRRFQRKYKKYFARKMAHYKDPKNLLHRSIHAKFPSIKY